MYKIVLFSVKRGFSYSLLKEIKVNDDMFDVKL